MFGSRYFLSRFFSARYWRGTADFVFDEDRVDFTRYIQQSAGSIRFIQQSSVSGRFIDQSRAFIAER